MTRNTCLLLFLFSPAVLSVTFVTFSSFVSCTAIRTVLDSTFVFFSSALFRCCRLNFYSAVLSLLISDNLIPQLTLYTLFCFNFFFSSIQCCLLHFLTFPWFIKNIFYSNNNRLLYKYNYTYTDPDMSWNYVRQANTCCLQSVGLTTGRASGQ